MTLPSITFNSAGTAGELHQHISEMLFNGFEEEEERNHKTKMNQGMSQLLLLVVGCFFHHFVRSFGTIVVKERLSQKNKLGEKWEKSGGAVEWIVSFLRT